MSTQHFFAKSLPQQSFERMVAYIQTAQLHRTHMLILGHETIHWKFWSICGCYIFDSLPCIGSDSQEVPASESDVEQSALKIYLTFKRYVFDPTKKMRQ